MVDPATGNLLPATAPYKILQDGHVIIIRDGKRYDVTGLRLTE